jgi:hypothetical protein
MGLLDFFQSGDQDGLGGLLRNSAFNQNLNAGIGTDNAMYGQLPGSALPAFGNGQPGFIGPQLPYNLASTPGDGINAASTSAAALPNPAPFSLAGNPMVSATQPMAAQPSSSFGDRLSAGFQSWAHTPVGSPFEAIANGVQGLTTGQRTDPASLNQQKQDVTTQLLMKNGAPEDIARAAQGNPDLMKLTLQRYVAPRLQPPGNISAPALRSAR